MNCILQQVSFCYQSMKDEMDWACGMHGEQKCVEGSDRKN